MITSVSQIRARNLVQLTAVSDLSGTVYFFWYVDGAYIGMSASGTKTIMLPVGEQAVVSVLDSNDPAYDAVANAPAGYPARRSLFWFRSQDADVAQYLIEQKRASDAWETLAYEPDDPAAWSYQFLTGRLDDLTNYQWRITPIDAAGNAGAAVTLGAELIVRTPDAPQFTATLQLSTEVLFEAA